MPDSKYLQPLVRASLKPLLDDLPSAGGGGLAPGQKRGGTRVDILTRLLEQGLLARVCGLHLKSGGEIVVIGHTERGANILNVKAGKGRVVFEGTGLRGVVLGLFQGKIGDEERCDPAELGDDGAMAVFESAAEVAP